jgi:hypothetical protein
MKYNMFITEVFKGHISLPLNIIDSYTEWAAFEKTLDPEGVSASTTIKGWQYVFGTAQHTPAWLESLIPYIGEIKAEVAYNTVKSMWTVDYEVGGFQDAHFHQPGNNLYTIIINLSGQGELILFDPRQLATAHGESISKIETLNPGDWIAMPSWLIHGTRPSLNHRSILVMDVNK